MTGFRMILDLEPDLQVVGEAADGARGLRRGRATCTRRRADGHPHAAAGRDRGDPSAHGGRPTRRKVLVLTTFDLDEYVYAALRAGRERVPAQGRAPRAARRRCARRRPRRVTARARHHASAGGALRPVARAGLGRTGRLQALSARELEVLGLMAAGLSNAEISARAGAR